MALIDDINALLPDNDAGEITPADLRAVMEMLLENPGFVGAQGEQGEQGIQGIQGIQGEPGEDGEDGAGGLPPVGAIVWFNDDTDPATAYGGGTWARYGEGRTLVSQHDGTAAFDTAGETGGAATVTLTAAQSGSPAHAHIQRSNTSTSGSSGAGHARDTSTSGGPSNNWFTTADNTAADAAEAHENMPPYIVAYAWVRTA
jgi:hypothetical protein